MDRLRRHAPKLRALLVGAMVLALLLAALWNFTTPRGPLANPEVQEFVQQVCDMAEASHLDNCRVTYTSEFRVKSGVKYVTIIFEAEGENGPASRGHIVYLRDGHIFNVK